MRTVGLVLSFVLLLGAFRRRRPRSIGDLLVPLAVIWFFVWLLGGLR
jgi:hypothetical protein